MAHGENTHGNKFQLLSTPVSPSLPSIYEYPDFWTRASRPIQCFKETSYRANRRKDTVSRETKPSSPNTKHRTYFSICDTVNTCIRLRGFIEMPTSIRLPEEIEKRLDTLAQKTGRTKAYYIREMILEKIDDIEDYYLAAHRAEKIRQGKERVFSSEHVREDLGLDD